MLSLVEKENLNSVTWLNFQDFYDIANCLNICLKGAYSQKEVACNAYGYYSAYECSLELGSVENVVVELAKKLNEALSTGFDDENCLWWLYCLARDFHLIDGLSIDEFRNLEDKLSCFESRGKQEESESGAELRVYFAAAKDFKTGELYDCKIVTTSQSQAENLATQFFDECLDCYDFEVNEQEYNEFDGEDLAEGIYPNGAPCNYAWSVFC